MLNVQGSHIWCQDWKAISRLSHCLFKMFVCFVITPDSAQCLHLGFLSGVTHCILRRPNGVLGISPGLTVVQGMHPTLCTITSILEVHFWFYFSLIFILRDCSQVTLKRSADSKAYRFKGLGIWYCLDPVVLCLCVFIYMHIHLYIRIYNANFDYICVYICIGVLWEICSARDWTWGWLADPLTLSLRDSCTIFQLLLLFFNEFC